MGDDATGANPMTPPTNPHAELVEALRPTNGWAYGRDGEWDCPTCETGPIGGAAIPAMHDHDVRCLTRLALEYTPPPLPKLTPLPKYEYGDLPWTLDSKKRAWFDANRRAIESIIQQQQEPQSMTGEQYGSMSDLAIRFQEIENRLNKLEQSERIHESNQNVILETVKVLAGTECPCDQTSDEFCDLMKRVDALESKPDIMTWLPSVLKDTDMRTRELERKRPYTTEWRVMGHTRYRTRS